MIPVRHPVALILWLACAGPVPAGDTVVAPDPEQQPAEALAAEPTTGHEDSLFPGAMAPADGAGTGLSGESDPGPATAGAPAAMDAAAAWEAPLFPDPAQSVPEPGPEPVTAIPEPAPVDGAAPATTSASAEPAPMTAPGAADRTRSLLIMVSGGVLLVTLALIVFLLVKRGREARRQDRQYVAEAYLRDVSGSTTQSMFRLGSKPVMLGRVGGKDTEFLDYIVIPSATIGRRHALIEFKDFGYWIMDQGSINGTFVNNRPVSTEVRLKHGDRIRLHKLEFEFVMPEVSESSVTVLAPDAPRAAAAAAIAAATPAPEESDFVLEPEPDVELPAGDLDALRERMESGDATLLPSGPPDAAEPAGPGDETLLPAAGSVAATDTEETLLPASGAGARRPAKGEPQKKGDEFFDITGGD